MVTVSKKSRSKRRSFNGIERKLLKEQFGVGKLNDKKSREDVTVIISCDGETLSADQVKCWVDNFKTSLGWGEIMCVILFLMQQGKPYKVSCISLSLTHTHTHFHTRTLIHTHTHTHTQFYFCLQICYGREIPRTFPYRSTLVTSNKVN